MPDLHKHFEPNKRMSEVIKESVSVANGYSIITILAGQHEAVRRNQSAF